MGKKFMLFIASAITIVSGSKAQNVGIGITNPTRARLEVNGAVDATTAIFGGEGSGISIQRNWPGIGFNNYYNAGNKNIAGGYSGKLFLDPSTGYLFLDMFSAANANVAPPSSYRAFTISPIGNIGVGGASTNAQLQLPNTLNNRKLVLWESVNNDRQFFGFGIEPGTLTYNVGGTGDVHRFYCGNGPGSSISLMSIGGNKKVVIGTQGGTSRVGINSGDPMYALEVVQADHTGLVIIDPVTYNNWEIKTEQVGSNGNYLFFRYNGGGGPFIQPDGSYHSASDERLKEDIQPMPELLPKLMQLKPKTYAMKYNNPAHKRSIGFVAQELQEFFPELVSVVDGTLVGYKQITDMYAVNYSGLSVLAIKAIQEQQHRMDVMEQEIVLLKEQNKLLLQMAKK